MIDEKKTSEAARKQDQNYINNALVDVYDNIMRFEEQQIRGSRFRDINARELHIVHAIGLHDHKTTSQVAREFRMSKGTLTAHLNNLERKGYIERHRNPDDRRVINLGLTSKGRLLYRVHDAFHRRLVNSFLAGMDDDDRQLIKQALMNLEEFLDEAQKK
ncbi:MarR family transcriptional regulator [Schleiferilactobacillus harbinensis]|jgi:DNA-binding MarR family transcriptional regulator|uniref:MarR family transcriptional regulator n=2 Tax=Schleiferilactobacillus harbinensis TaxID=304207 RepID=A0A510TX81_9LACO|nr:MarR family transcriptional regulator [Schleiferilactobacillus harbinensis]HAY53371.1 transcriptional regulator [Lactobacillus sp.]KRM29713.1 transcriptional regulator [Schleiferilactobacillus harbinensis DSM 16991]MBO3092644.1 MarR family transcriptional regulator [Schleiferilactobacillus harbinensis]MCI1686459.1 MarR family transcriptional regulator [Schleiferilactobacillus harbinensis]MCI1782914.1 MarR family transcriptional regulator [Schleiferilactobacillus harbinensis]